MLVHAPSASAKVTINLHFMRCSFDALSPEGRDSLDALGKPPVTRWIDGPVLDHVARQIFAEEIVAFPVP
jgi:hypothetical protein